MALDGTRWHSVALGGNRWPPMAHREIHVYDLLGNGRPHGTRGLQQFKLSYHAVCFMFFRAESDEYGREKVFTCLGLRHLTDRRLHERAVSSVLRISALGFSRLIRILFRP